MDLNDSLKKLVEEYGLQQNQHPFLLVDLSGGKENTHTNILLSLLRFNDYMFFGSFLTDVLNMPDWNEDTSSVKISTQKPAVGLKPNKKTNGFIDLYIKYVDNTGQEQIIVIENKINGATDTQKQMLRYIASVKSNPISEPKAFDAWEKNTIKPSKEGDENKREQLRQECRNRLFVYLTLDKCKDPSEDSLPQFLYESRIINYTPISYQDDILQWLKDTVLHSCPYYDDGIVVSGLRQYIASLEGLLSRDITVSETVAKYVADTVSASNIIDAYKSLGISIETIEKYSKNLSDDNKIDICNRLVRELRKAAEEYITKDAVPNGWVLHLSPTFLVLYKPEWMRIARGSYSIPFINLYASSKAFLGGKSMKWQLHIEHFSPDNWNEWKIVNGINKITSTNHDRTACYELGKCKIDASSANSRRESLESFINEKDDIISIVDNVIDTIDNNKTTYKNDKEVRVSLFNQLADTLIKY